MKKDENSTFEAPLYNALNSYIKQGYTPFHMPGHKQGKGFPVNILKNASKIDLTELPGLDDLHYPEGAIKKAQELAAELFRAERSYFLVNGSTSGILASIMAICRPGQKIILQRDSHSSVVNGLILSGAEPVFIQSVYDKRFGINSAVEAGSLGKILKENPDAAGVVLTRPTYYGVCSDLGAIIKIAHSYGKPVVVDEAHGAHLGFADYLPESAMDIGADISIQSTHKTLPALTQTALLHSRGNRIDIERLEYYLKVFQTTSPSYLLMASIDICRAIIKKDGNRLLVKLRGYIDSMAKQIENCGCVRMMQTKDLAFGSRQDVTRLVLNFEDAGLSGLQVSRILRNDYRIQAEMADLYNVVFISSVSDNKKDIEKLTLSLLKICKSIKQPAVRGNNMPDLPPVPDRIIPLRETTEHAAQKILLKNANGLAAATMLTPYPPGIPLVWPGEVISEDIIAYFEAVAAHGGKINGVNGDMRVSVLG